MDPPWENKSVARKENYKTFYMKRLLQLPIPQLLPTDDGFCIVMIWVTNNPKISNFIQKDLLVKWNLEYLTTWQWLKCNDYGQPVCPLDTVHRKPYEPIIIGVYNPNSIPIPSDLREPKLIISTPSVIQHSRKPPLQSIVDPILSELLGEDTKIRRLELFARNLNSGWCSWGNEVLLHQEASYFNKKAVD